MQSLHPRLLKVAFFILLAAAWPDLGLAQGNQDPDKSGKKQNSRNEKKEADGTGSAPNKKGDGGRNKRPADEQKVNPATGPEMKKANPTENGEKGKPNVGLTPVEKLQPAATAGLDLRRPDSLHKYQISKSAMGYKYEASKSKNGHVQVRMEKSKTNRDDIRKRVAQSDGDMCLTREEVSGQKIENEIVIADGSMALQILPGGVIDTDELLQSGNFVYQHMDLRKPLSVSTTSNLANRKNVDIRTERNGGINESEMRDAIFSLSSPKNFLRGAMPNVNSESSLEVSTFTESLGVDVGASFFYMGVRADGSFGFSSEKYSYMYLYQFDQTFLPLIADGVSSPDDLFTETIPNANGMAYIREVKYGRRLYVLLESEYDLEKYNAELKGKANWLAVSGAFSQSTSGSKLQSKTNIRILTQGGKSVALTDPAKLQKTIDDYFESKYSENDIVPLAYKLTDLNGQPISMVTEAFLNNNNCLKVDKFRVRLTEVTLEHTDNGKPQEIYGGASIFLYAQNGTQVYADGRTPVPNLSIQLPSSSVTFASKETPLELAPGRSKKYGLNEQGRYAEFLVNDLDMEIEIRPYLHERDSFKDDDFTTNNRFRKSLRQLLLESSTSTSFELQTKQTRTKLFFEILPQY